MKKAEIQLRAAISVIAQNNTLVFKLLDKINKLELEKKDLIEELKRKTLEINENDIRK